MYNNYSTALEAYLAMYNEYKKELIDKLPDFQNTGTETTLFDYIENKGFTELPASLNHHLNHRGGLLTHSVNVIQALQKLTINLGLIWDRPESPIIVGLCHDLCKLEFYKTSPENDKYFVHNDNPELDFGGHGMLSVVLAQKYIKLTDEELHCIRFHMGAYEQKDWSKFDAAIKKYPNVLYTHTADMIASKIIER